MKTTSSLLVALAALLPFSSSCVTDLGFEVEGKWSGQWSSATTTGNLEVTFSGKTSFGDMTLYDVTLVATGPTCPSGQDQGSGDRTAAFRTKDVNFAVRMIGGAPGAGEGIMRFDGAFFTSREINGSYALTSDSCPVCTCGMGESGSWTLFK